MSNFNEHQVGSRARAACGREPATALVAWDSADQRWPLLRTQAAKELAKLLTLLLALMSLRTTAFEVAYGEPLMRWQADLLISEQNQPPVSNENWAPVQLPETWRSPERYQQGIQGWYRFRLDGKPPPEPWSVYLWRFSMNAEVWFNDNLVGSGGTFDEPIARNWNRPLLFSLPSSAWQSDVNYLYVRLRVYPGFGHMTPIAAGPTQLLQPDYERRFFYQITLVGYAWIVSIMIALVGFAMWVANRNDMAHLYFALCGLSWSLFSANQFVQNIPVSALTWWWLTHTGNDLFGLMLMLFVHRLFQLHHPWVERIAWCWWITAALLYAISDLPLLARINPIVHLGLLAIALHLVITLARQALTKRNGEALFFAIAIGALFALGVHDSLLNALVVPSAWRTQFYLSQFGAAVMFFVFVIHLSLRLARSLREVQQANEVLEAKVAAATDDIKVAYEQRTALERDRAAAEERERIYQDLHDDVGARLLSLIYAANDETQARLARSALAEIRTIVSTKPLQDCELTELAADWRSATETRCEEAGFELDWQVQGDAHISARQRFQMDRVLRELISNALEHSAGTQVWVHIRAHEQSLEMEVRDNGKGFSPDEPRTSKGLSGVQQRIAGLKGTVQWSTSNHGTTCSIRVPLQTPTEERPAPSMLPSSPPKTGG